MNAKGKKSLLSRLFGKKVTSSYESELKTTLLLILLFLILTSFSSMRVIGRLTEIYRQDSYGDLESSSARLIEYVRKDVEIYSNTKKYREYLSHSDVARAFYIQRELLDNSPAQIEPASKRTARMIIKYYGQLSSLQKAELADGGIVRLGYGLDNDKNRIAVFYPFRDISDRVWLGLFFKNAAGLRLVDSAINYNYIFQLGGILAILLVAYAYLKLTLNPFRAMADEARKVKARIDPNSESVEEIVETFRATIQRLEENEEKLKELYSNSQKRADRLEQFNQYILESMLSGLIGIDRGGRILHLNKSARDILELEEDNIDYASYLNTFKKYPKLIEIFESIVREKTTLERFEYSIDTQANGRRFLGISGSPVYDHRDRLVGAIMLMADLTEVRRLQHEVAFKEKMAAVGEMSAGLAHEMRNAMMAIVGYSKILNKISAENSQEHEIACSISDESEMCETMLKRFLMFAKPAALTPEPVSLNDLGQSVVQKLKPVADENNVTLKMDISENIPSIIGDRTVLDQIITNLLKNAVEAAPENGQAGIGISYDSQKPEIAIEINDNGPGIDEELRLKIFSPFFTTRDTGTGLGLAIVKKLVSTIGGSIEINSEVGRGTKFRVSFKPELAVEIAKNTSPQTAS